MSDSQQPPSDAASSAARQALTTATNSARSGARMAVGTLFAGANVLLDLGVRVARSLPEGASTNGREIQLETPDGEMTAVAITTSTGSASDVRPMGWWLPDGSVPQVGDDAMNAALKQVGRSLFVVQTEDGPAVATTGRAVVGADALGPGDSKPLIAFAPAVLPEQLGDAAFRKAHGVKYCYVAGAMANGIASVEIVEAMSRAGMLGFFGAAGLPLAQVEVAIDRIQASLGDQPYGFNLIHSPNEPQLEAGVVDLYLRRGVHLVSASAYLDLTLPLVKYRVAGIHRDTDGRVVCPNKVVGKVSRVEVARKFMSPPPAGMLDKLVAAGFITAEQARLARTIPIATDITVEADSGGHTDNRPALSLFPGMVALRDEIQRDLQYTEPPRLGLAGGIATPASVAAAFSMGAAYVLTGSINQACVEAGTSDTVRQMLAEAGQADVIMAPAADMFEMGVKVQVLKRGTMFPMRARKLYDWYRECASLETMPTAARASLERDYLKCTVEEAWGSTRRFFETRDPAQIARAEKDAKHKMALVFRSYLGQSSNWANSGEPSRRVDYQVWCGPAMGAFNEWSAGSFLAQTENRRVEIVGRNLMMGASVLMRAAALRAQGVPLSPTATAFAPHTAEKLDILVNSASGAGVA